MSDGVRLALDYYLPIGREVSPKKTFPAILVLTPYYRRFKLEEGADSETDSSPGNGLYRDLFVPRGYAVVVADVRGTGASFGHREGFRAPNERRDFSELAHWICDKSWSDGRIGAGGISYLGAGAEFLAGTGHPAVKAIAPMFAVWDTYSDNYYPGGVRLNALIESYQRVIQGLDQCDSHSLEPYEAYQNSDFAGGPQPVDDDPDGELLDKAISEHAESYSHQELMREFSFREDPLPYDSNYSSATFSPYKYAYNVPRDVAIYSVSGWMDGAGYSNGAISRFLVQNENPRHLMLGPWDHGARTDISPWRESSFPDDLWVFEILRFFDHYLMELPTGLDREDPVHYFTVHREEWQSAVQWPLEAPTQVLQLHSDNSLSSAPAESGTIEYQADFSIGTGHKTRYERIAAVAVDSYYSDWNGRTSGHLKFESERLTESQEFTGHGIVTLTLASSEPDAQIFVYISEQTTDGTEHYITEGLLRLLHRKTVDAPSSFPPWRPFRSFTRMDAEPLVPGRFERITIPLLPTSWRLSAGSRLVVSLAAHDADHVMQIPHGRPPRLTIRTGDNENVVRLPFTI